jgi:hypothetical protein
MAYAQEPNANPLQTLLCDPFCVASAAAKGLHGDRSGEQHMMPPGAADAVDKFDPIARAI